jgi:transcriptional regulator with XRE-family HTH domain
VVKKLSETFIPLKHFRTKAGFTQVELSKASGVSQQAISKVEMGKSKPNYYSAVKMAEVLKCTPEELMGIKKKSKLDALKAKLASK